MFDWLLEKATVIDGGGGAPYTADLGISGGKIAAVGSNLGGEALNRLDCENRTVTPGFIDIHRHADAALFREGFGEMELRQGITTIVNGNCGMSVAPLPRARRAEILRYLSPVTGILPDAPEFESYSEYAALLKRDPLPLNVGALAGSGTMRAAACGYQIKCLDGDSLKKVRENLQDAISAGVCGVSVGFAYMPDMYYTPEALAEALAPMADSGLPLVCHVRGEGDLLYESVREAIRAAGLLRVPLEISHFKCIGRHNWGIQLGKTIELIERARQDGADIRCDVYPWTAGSTQMACLLPPDFLRGGMSAAAERLRDPKQRVLCRDAMSRPGADFENIVLSMGWQSVYVSGLKSEKNRWCIGKNVEEIAAELKADPFDSAFDLLADEDCDITMVDYIACEEDIDTILRLPYSCVISDTVYPDSGRLHPRSFGNTAVLLGEYVQKGRALTLEQAVRKLTSLPAQAFRLKGKGLISPGYDADLVP